MSENNQTGADFANLLYNVDFEYGSCSITAAEVQDEGRELLDGVNARVRHLSHASNEAISRKKYLTHTLVDRLVISDGREMEIVLVDNFDGLADGSYTMHGVVRGQVLTDWFAKFNPTTTAEDCDFVQFRNETLDNSLLPEDSPKGMAGPGNTVTPPRMANLDVLGELFRSHNIPVNFKDNEGIIRSLGKDYGFDSQQTYRLLNQPIKSVHPYRDKFDSTSKVIGSFTPEEMIRRANLTSVFYQGAWPFESKQDRNDYVVANSVFKRIIGKYATGYDSKSKPDTKFGHVFAIEETTDFLIAANIVAGIINEGRRPLFNYFDWDVENFVIDADLHAVTGLEAKDAFLKGSQKWKTALGGLELVISSGLTKSKKNKKRLEAVMEPVIDAFESLDRPMWGNEPFSSADIHGLPPILISEAKYIQWCAENGVALKNALGNPDEIMKLTKSSRQPNIEEQQSIKSIYSMMPGVSSMMDSIDAPRDVMIQFGEYTPVYEQVLTKLAELARSGRRETIITIDTSQLQSESNSHNRTARKLELKLELGSGDIHATPVKVSYRPAAMDNANFTTHIERIFSIFGRPTTEDLEQELKDTQDGTNNSSLKQLNHIFDMFLDAAKKSNQEGDESTQSRSARPITNSQKSRNLPIGRMERQEAKRFLRELTDSRRLYE